MSDHHVAITEFETREALAQALADQTADALRSAISDGGAATLAVSGGSTPKLYFQKLSLAELDWESVTVTLVDERWVPESSERSNARLVKENLLQNEAHAASFVPLYTGAASPEDGLHEVAERVADLSGPVTVAILGMGDDGHTASFFPGGDRLAYAIDPTSHLLVQPMRADAAGEPRITLTLPVLLAATMLVLHVEGDGKKKVLETALAGKDATEMPIRAVVAHSPHPLQIVWAP